MKNIGEKLKKIFNPKPVTGYVSDIDKSFEEFDKTHSLSASQIAEMNKHQRIAALRDQPAEQDLKSKIWEGFE